MTIKKRNCTLKNLDLVKYDRALLYQRSLVRERINHPHLDDILILLEHPAVYTLGTGSTLDFLKFDLQNSDFEIYRIERGGEVTYHCPNQLVGYPIINLRYYKQDLHWYLRQLEEVIIKTVANYDLKAYRIPKLTGVWLAEKKIAAIGIKVKRWIAMHGFALNVCPNLDGFQHIVPCGIANKPVGSLAEFVPDITVATVRKDLARAFAEVFQVNLVEEQLSSMNYESNQIETNSRL